MSEVHVLIRWVTPHKSNDPKKSFSEKMLLLGLCIWQQNRVKKVLKSEVSKRRSKKEFTKLYTNLSKNELIEELDDRGIH